MASKSLDCKGKKMDSKAQKSKLRSLIDYFIDSRMELRKVSWPTKKETLVTGVVVFVVVLIVSLFLGVVDFIISGIIRYLLSL